MKKKKDNKLVSIFLPIACLAVVGLLFVGMQVKAEGSFWGNIQQLIANRVSDKVIAETPSFDLPEMFSAMASPDVYSYMRVHGYFNYKMPVFATTTTSTTETIAGIDLLDYGYWDVMSNVGNLTYTLPATSTMMDILPGVGMSRTWLFHNATSSTITLTIAAGTGMHLVGVADAETIDAEEWAELTCTQIYYRTADNENILCIITELEE